MERILLDIRRNIRIRNGNTDDKQSENTEKLLKEQRNKLIGKVNKPVRERIELTELEKVVSGR